MGWPGSSGRGKWNQLLTQVWGWRCHCSLLAHAAHKGKAVEMAKEGGLCRCISLLYLVPKLLKISLGWESGLFPWLQKAHWYWGKGGGWVWQPKHLEGQVLSMCASVCMYVRAHADYCDAKPPLPSLVKCQKSTVMLWVCVTFLCFSFTALLEIIFPSTL